MAVLRRRPGAEPKPATATARDGQPQALCRAAEFCRGVAEAVPWWAARVDGLEALKKMGVGVVIDMRGTKSSHEQLAVRKLGMEYIAIPWHCPFPSDAIFARFLKVIHEHPKKKVFVHCRLGDDRTGMAVAAYRMANEGWSADDALKEMEEFGFRRETSPDLSPRWSYTKSGFRNVSGRIRCSKIYAPKHKKQPANRARSSA